MEDFVKGLQHAVMSQFITHSEARQSLDLYIKKSIKEHKDTMNRYTSLLFITTIGLLLLCFSFLLRAYYTPRPIIISQGYTLDLEKAFQSGGLRIDYKP